jgi:hypothetical protein
MTEQNGAYARGHLPGIRELFQVTDREKKIAGMRSKSYPGRVVSVHAGTVHDLLSDIRFLLSELEDERRQHEFERQQHDELRETARKLIDGLNSYLKELDRRWQKAHQNYDIDHDHHQLGMAEAYEVAEYRLREILKEIGVKVE